MTFVTVTPLSNQKQQQQQQRSTTTKIIRKKNNQRYQHHKIIDHHDDDDDDNESVSSILQQQHQQHQRYPQHDLVVDDDDDDDDEDTVHDYYDDDDDDFYDDDDNDLVIKTNLRCENRHITKQRGGTNKAAASSIVVSPKKSNAKTKPKVKTQTLSSTMTASLSSKPSSLLCFQRRLVATYGPKFILEVLGSSGAIWGSSEVFGLRTETTTEMWRHISIFVGILFAIRWCTQLHKSILLDHPILCHLPCSRGGAGGRYCQPRRHRRRPPSRRRCRRRRLCEGEDDNDDEDYHYYDDIEQPPSEEEEGIDQTPSLSSPSSNWCGMTTEPHCHNHSSSSSNSGNSSSPIRPNRLLDSMSQSPSTMIMDVSSLVSSPTGAEMTSLMDHHATNNTYSK